MKIFFLPFLFIFFSVSAQNQRVVFDEFSPDSEIAYDQIEHILIDQDGFLWLATSTGLHKYDGYDYQTFLYNANDINSISENFASIVFEDSKGKIWVGTYNNGINIYDKEFQAFYNSRHQEGNGFTLTSNKISRRRNAITEDENGFIWVSTENGLNRIDPETKEIRKFYGELSGHLVYDESSKSIWVADKSLKNFNIETGEIKTINSEIQFQQINALINTEDDFLWIGTNKGLQVLNTKKQEFINPQSLFSSSHTSPEWIDKSITSIYKDYQNRLWMAVEKSVYVLNPQDGTFEVLDHYEENKNGLLKEVIRGIYGDNKGTIYITYEGRGITRIKAKNNHFELIQNKLGENNTQISNIRSIFQDKENLWLGTYNHGLICLDKNNYRQLKNYSHSPSDSNSINSNFITAIFRDSGNRLWVGTFEDGFCYSDIINTQLPRKFIRSKLNRKVEVHEFTEDPFGRIWISTNLGLYIYDKQNENLVQYGEGKNQIPEMAEFNVQSLVFENPNIFWIATWNKGIARITLNSDSLFNSNPSKDELLLFDQIQNEEGTTLDNRFISALKDKKKNLWFASNVNGLVKVSEENGKFHFRKYDKLNGAPSNSIYGILEDNSGNIWVSSSNGIGKFDPEKEQFINFYESDGLQSNTFIWDSQFQSADGQIFFGGIKGLNSFYPDSINIDAVIPKSYLKKLVVNHKEVEIGEKVNGKILMEKSIRYTKELTLSHSESIFSIEFAARDIQNVKEIQFEYMLENFDSDWIRATSENRIATYTNLKRGEYFFKVRATRNYGIWQEPSSLKIIILPPWWKSYMAYFIYFLIFSLLLYLFKMELSKRLVLKHSLELEHYKHERDNELNQEKFQFFTNLSHELRTPLTLIIGPLDRIIRKNETSARIHQNLVLIQNQAQKLQKLTNQLLTFRKYDAKNIKLRTAEGNIVKFLKEIEIAFKQHAKSKEIHFKLSTVKENINLNWDRDKLEIVIVNLLSNAFKFTPQQGKVNLKCKEIGAKEFKQKLESFEESRTSVYGEIPESTSKLVEIEISDSGCGINKEQIKHIFDRYFQAGNAKTLAVGGTGIGLEIAKNYVEIHHGCILVNSELEKGSTFLIWLPIGTTHLETEEIIQDFKSSEHLDHYFTTELKLNEKYAVLNSGEEIKSHDKELSTILVVDDNLDIVFFLKEIFSKNYNVITAENGKEGLEKAFEEIPDLIVSDIMMPVMDGLEFCKTLKSDIRTSHIPVILLTARTSTVFQAEGLEIGADDYINKPFNERILNIRVKNLIASRKALRERYQKEITLQPKDMAISHPDEKFLDRILDFIEKNIADNNLKVEQIARELGLSHSVLYKKILALTGLTVVEFIRTIRLKKAAIVLVKTNMNIGQVGYEVGFTDPKYFSKCFQKQFGTTPSQYRKSKAVL